MGGAVDIGDGRRGRRRHGPRRCRARCRRCAIWRRRGSG
jgi:hypothetical protein